jgi:hypothetical protein
VQQGVDKCSREVAKGAAVVSTSRMARVALSRQVENAAKSREMASAAGEWQVQQWPVEQGGGMCSNGQ